MDKSANSCPNYYESLKKIDEKDLRFVEKDLAFYEKVSLAFLLYGDDKVQAEYILQNLIILSRAPHEQSELLFNYTKQNRMWRPKLIESLTIIKEYKILRKLGFNVKELREIFLPHIPQVTLYVHPLLKGLYIMCEALTQIECGKIVFEMKNINELANNIRFYDTKYLEIYLLDWITKSIINIGKWINDENFQITKNNCNLEKLYQCLKLYELDDIKEMLQNTIEHMNKKFIEKQLKNNDKIDEKKLTKESLNHNENDSALTIASTSSSTTTTNINNFERRISYDVKHDECYQIRKNEAGFILIINQQKFYRDNNPEIQDLLPEKSLPIRRGTQMDCVRLEDTFKSYGYRSVIKNDLTNVQIISEIRDIVKRSIVFDSLIVCILSHGIQGAVYGSNSIPVEIQQIQHILADENLLRKPKLLIIQACQGEDLQKAKFIKKFEYDKPEETSAPAFSDMLTATSTVPGFASIRHIEKGTWFIQTFCKIVDNQGDRKHMLDILTSVTNEVSKKRGSENQCMVPLFQSTLSKSFYLPKRF